MENYAFAGGEICRRHRKRNAQLFEGFDLQQIVQKSDHPLIAGEAIPGERPARKMFEAYAGGNLLQFSSRDSAAIRRSD
jgi:hypothetical protein